MTAALDRLVAPRGVEEPGDHHSARLVAGLALCFVVLGTGSIVVELALIPEFHRQAAVQGCGTLLLLAAYVLARGPMWRLGGAFLSAAPILTASFVLYLDPLDAVAPAFMLLGVVFATFFLRFRHAAGMAGGVFALLLSLLWLQPELREPLRAIPLLVMFVIAAPCLLWISAHRDRVERIRGAALREDERLRAGRERLEMVGRLASGIAHDFNNLLSVVRVNSDVLLESAAPRDRPMLEELRVVADRGAALIQTLLSFARKAPLDVRPLDLNEAVARVGVLLTRLLGDRTALKVQQAAELPLVLAATPHVEQIIMNLVLNARDAMEEGGTVHVITEQVDGCARLSVTDTGTGMSSETARRIFEPFFTTKPTGSGLGLATVHTIVSQLGARIDVDSREGTGTTIRVTFPPPPATDPTPAPSARAARSVLVVDDDELVRRMIQRVLEADGHAVQVASSGAEALRALEADRDTAVLVTDVSMPGMTGPQLVERARALAPKIRVLYVSALPDRSEHPKNGDGILGKPFAPQALRDAVASL